MFYPHSYFPQGVPAEKVPDDFEDSGFIATDFSETSTVVSPLASPASVKRSKKYNHSELSRFLPRIF